MPQKEASTHLTKLWAKDPFKPKWQIIAEAYSLIRDKVGKASAPLDQFLGHVCPEIGIIRVSDYLKTMGWEVVGAVDGTITLQQMSTPDFSTLARKILLTPMSAHDLVRIVAAKSYITPRIALAIVTPAPNLPTGPPPPRRRMQGQLAVGLQSTPRVPLVFNESPIEAASIVLGFNVAHFMLTAPSTQPIEWTGNMADLYNPESGHIDHPDFQNSNEVDQEDQWHTTNISDPQEFSDVFTDSIRDGYMMPNGKYSQYYPGGNDADFPSA
jgi:hypothetical protein